MRWRAASVNLPSDTALLPRVSHVSSRGIGGALLQVAQVARILLTVPLSKSLTLSGVAARFATVMLLSFAKGRQRLGCCRRSLRRSWGFVGSLKDCIVASARELDVAGGILHDQRADRTEEMSQATFYAVWRRLWGLQSLPRSLKRMCHRQLHRGLRRPAGPGRVTWVPERDGPASPLCGKGRPSLVPQHKLWPDGWRFDVNWVGATIALSISCSKTLSAFVRS